MELPNSSSSSVLYSPRMSVSSHRWGWWVCRVLPGARSVLLFLGSPRIPPAVLPDFPTNKMTCIEIIWELVYFSLTLLSLMAYSYRTWTALGTGRMVCMILCSVFQTTPGMGTGSGTHFLERHVISVSCSHSHCQCEHFSATMCY